MNSVNGLPDFGYLAPWVTSRLSQITKDFGDANYDFYLEGLTLDPKVFENNKCSVIFLTSEEIIKAYFTLNLITIEKRKLFKINKVLKNIETSADDSFMNGDVKCISVDLHFQENDILSLVLPTLKNNDNLGKYKKLVSKF